MCQLSRNNTYLGDTSIVKTQAAHVLSTGHEKVSSPMRVLLVSENVAPQVNGIARRVTHYAEGLRDLGCDVHLLSPESVDESTGLPAVLPFTNPWNFTAEMFVIRPKYFMNLAFRKGCNYDVVHFVLPANLSGCLLLSAFRLARLLNNGEGPNLVVSWHCNLVDYTSHILPAAIVGIVKFAGVLGVGILPGLSDRLLTPTKATEPVLTELYGDRHGVCYTGMSKTNFNPKMKESEWGQIWQQRKQEMLAETDKKYLLICVGRVSPEKGVDELLKTMPLLEDCILWLIGDGPARGGLECLARNLNIPVKFWGYQRGEALHAVYTMADCFVCPSLTETFGQTVNEAIASRVPIALPAVHVFKEAYGDWLPKDAMWEPLNRPGMATAIKNQLARGDSALPDPTKLKSWSDACSILLEDYHEASKGRRRITFTSLFFLPSWWTLTIFTAFVIFVFAHIRSIFGGSVRHFFKTTFVKACQEGPSQTFSPPQELLLLDPAAGLSWYLTKSNRAYTKPRFYFNTVFISVLAVAYICNPPHFVRIDT